MRRLYTYEFIRDEFIKNGLILLSSKEEYKNSAVGMICKDKDGYIGKVSLSSIQRGKTFKPFSIRNKFGLDNLKTYFKNKGFNCKPLFYVLPNSKENAKFQCECGNIFYATLDSVINSDRHTCIECSNKHRVDSCRHSFDSVKESLLNSGYKILQNYL